MMTNAIDDAWRRLGSWPALFAFAGLGMLLRVLALLKLSGLPLASDALSYHMMALQLERGESFASYWPPGLPLYLASIYRIFGGTELAGRASMLLFFLLFSLGIYLLVRKLCSKTAANIAVLIFSIYPAHVHHSIEPLTQLPIATYLVWVAYVSIRLSEKTGRRGRAAFLGAILGLLVLTRASSFLLALVVPAYLLLRTREVRMALIPLAVSGVIVFGWVLKSHEMTGRWIFVNEANSLNFFFGNNPYTPLYKTWWLGSHDEEDSGAPAAYTEILESIRCKPPEVRDRLYLEEALTHIAHRPDLFLVRTANRVRCYFAFDTYTGGYLIKQYSVDKKAGMLILMLDAFFYCAVMVAAMVGLFGFSRGSPSAGNTLLLLLLAGCYALPYWLSFAHPTYHFPVVPLFGVLASCLAGSVMSPRQAGARRPWSISAKRKYVLIAVLLAFAYIQIEWAWVMRTRI
jgi:4-amino-4-deoxy-L-arabinose transferase-like glycosyltransferase